MLLGEITLSDQLSARMELLSGTANPELLTGIQRGIEKESLRITPEGSLSQTPHPHGLGSALTHPYITTDFSEALLEFITPVFTDIDSCLEFLDEVHRFAYSGIDGEQLWTASMPCALGGETSIPVARYGSSNVATMKTAYRYGLVHRYGSVMQTIAGIHYNFSLPTELWQVLQSQDRDTRAPQDYITDAYFSLIRNFRRYSWLLIYLYGASPAVCKSFLNGRGHQLQDFNDNSLYLPNSTALRMGELGYQSSAQQNLSICYNSVNNYIATLREAIRNTHPDYEKIGVKVDGEYRQLSTALLQIENEFYSPIRPKRVTHSGEIPLGALRQRGVEYIEVRCIDLNPYLPLGIDGDQVRFIDSFLLYCLLQQSPLCDDSERQQIKHNMQAVVNNGRDPQLQLSSADGDIGLPEWGHQLLDGIERVAEMLDRAHGGDDYRRVCRQQREKLDNPDLTPSAQMIADMRAGDCGFFHFARDLAQQHADYFLQRPLSEERHHWFTAESERSLLQQSDIEAADDVDFDRYLSDYYRQYDTLK